MLRVTAGPGRDAVAAIDVVQDIQPGDLVTALDEASLDRTHMRAVLASGMGFFTDA
jgi:hypothetical protein